MPFPRFRPALLALALAGWCHGDVVINEFQSSNGSTVLDEDGDPSDWIELRNRGEDPVNLLGWGLSDRTDAPFKWTFPAVEIAPGQRLLVWCSGKNRSGGDGPSIDSPDDIPGLVLWLRAEGESHPDGQAADTWTDLSGLGNHVAAPSAGNRPVFRANRVNGKPAFQFTRASAHEFRLPAATFNGMDSLNDMSLFMVARWAGSGTPSGLFGAWNTVSSTPSTHFEVESGGSLRLRVGEMDSVSVPAAVAGNEWAVLNGTMAGSGDSPLARLFKNGQFLGSKVQSPGDALLAAKEFLSIGASHNGRNFNGDIAEVLLYDRDLTAAERGFLDGHLGARYALPGAASQAGLEIHTNFSIDADGEDLVLTRPGGTTEDLVPAAAVPQDASYGRGPESGDAFFWFATPTPGQPNAPAAYGPPTGKPVLSEPRGFKEDAFQLAITHPDPAATIRFTLDGSEPSLANGTTYTVPLSIAQTRVVRAAAFKTGALPVRAIATHSYFFLDDIVGQTTAPAGYPSSWGSFSQTSYAISPTIAAQPGYAAAMKSALESFPTLSISIPMADMFGSGGIYANPLTRDFEKVASAEWISPDGSYDTQIDAGLRIQGGASRDHNNTPKKSMRLLFKGAYGEGRLRVPILSEGGTAMADFNSLVLRADYNNSWLHWENAQRLRGTTLRDQWMRDSQIAMSGIGSHGHHVHLYVNGRYWGVYNPSERPDAAFTASYLGGEREDYDAMTHRGIRDGDNVAWNAMRAIAQGGLSTPAQYAAIRQYLDVEQFADYMILNIYGGNTDWPNNNWNATRKREPGAGYRFFAWDAERTLEGTTQNVVNLTGSNNPAEFYAALRQNAEFRLLFADRVHRHFFNGGALTPAAAASRYSTRAAKVQAGIFAEHARWGAYRNQIHDRNGPSPIYGLDHWSAERDRLLDTYFPVRTGNVLAQFQAANLYPNVAAPAFSQHGGQLVAGQTVTLSAFASTIYYTLDGSDPRVAVTGAVSPTATAYTASLAITGQKTLKARVRTAGGVWSALNEAAFFTVLPESEFKPAGSGDWTLNSSWTPTPYPNGPGKRALIHAPLTDDRNINLRAPVTIGAIRFDETDNLWRNRVRDQNTGNTLTFDGGDQDALVRVDGNGTGFVEFEVLAGTVLANDLEVQVNHLAGNEEHGALRLRAAWSGPGGVRKTGPGVASFTGEDKNFAGPLSVEEGVLQLTGPSTPALASSVSVSPGGQLRLVSGSSPGSPREYGFETPLQLAGQGRGPVVPDDAGHGKQGALRYDPGNGDNHAIIPAPVTLTAAAGIHVDGSLNRLELAAPLTPAEFPLTKSGGGTLHLNAANASFTSPVTVANGTLELSGPLGSPVNLGSTGILTGHGGTGPLTGSGTVALGGKILAAPTLSGTVLSAVLANAGSPAYLSPAAADNGLLAVDAIAAPPLLCRIYLPNAGTTFRGLIFAPWDVDLAAAMHATSFEVYQPDGPGWSLATNAQIVTVPETADFGDGPVQGRIVEVRLGAPPASFAAWQALAFPGVTDPAVTGPDANPQADGIPNLLRHALGIPPGANPRDFLPRLVRHADGSEFRFPFDPGRDDIACLVEATEDLANWENADVLFDSRTDDPASMEDGWLVITDPATSARRFYRLRVMPR